MLFLLFVLTLSQNRKQKFISQIQIEAIVGPGPRGDIAIDDVSAVQGGCPECR